MRLHPRITRAALLVALTAGAVVGVPLIANATVFSATCHAAHGTTEYMFDGTMDVVPSGETSFGIKAYTAKFHGLDPDNPNAVPTKDADNDVLVQLLHEKTREILYFTSSPDTIDYNEPYVEELEEWNVPQFQLVQGVFLPSFDKRDVPDEHCRAMTNTFTASGTQANSDTFVCQKAPGPCRLIND